MSDKTIKTISWNQKGTIDDTIRAAIDPAANHMQTSPGTIASMMRKNTKQISQNTQ